MPFYLVTQTSLIEANDEHAAAETALEKITTAHVVSFAVRLNEDDTTYLTISRSEDAGQNLPQAGCLAREASLSGPILTTRGEVHAPDTGEPASKPTVRLVVPATAVFALVVMGASIGFICGLVL